MGIYLEMKQDVKMKKQIIISIIILGLLIGIIFAEEIFPTKDKIVKLSPEADAWYNDMGITPAYEDFTKGEIFGRKIISNTEYNLGYVSFYGEMNETFLDEQYILKLEDIAQTEINRTLTNNKVITQIGNIDITK